MKALLILISSTILLTACHKNKNTNALIGTWKLTETYRIGQPWTPVPPSGEVTLTFNNDYTYSILPPLISSAAGCNGTYRITDNNTVMLKANCFQLNPVYEEEFGFSKEGKVLIMDHRTTSSGVKSKYVRQ